MENQTDKKIRSSSIRFPSNLWDEITDSAKKNLRSTNSEIVIRLQRSLEQEQAAA